MDQVFDGQRASKKSASDKEEMMFVYLVTVELREKRLLDSNNKPSSDASLRFNVKRNCPISPVSNRNEIHLNKKHLF